jgi:homoprotocatechuate degradation regulator HpaR
MKPARTRFPRRNLPLLLLQARESIFAQFRPILHVNGVTEQQWRVVRALVERGPLEQREIGEVCRLSSPSLAGVLARMDDLGLVVRQRLDHDQRRVRVSVTPRSRALAARMAPQIEAAYRQLDARLGPGFVERLYETLDQVVATLGGDDEEPPDAT